MSALTRAARGLSSGGGIGHARCAVTTLLRALSAYGRLRNRARLRFPYLGRPLSTEAYGALAAKPGWSAAGIPVAPGVELRGLVRRPVAPEAPWVLFYPGNDAAPLRTGQSWLERLAAQRDWGLALFAYRGYDSSGGQPRLPDLAVDAPLVLTRLCSLVDISPERVHLVGFSLGGHFAVHAARAAAQQQRNAATLTLLAGVNDIVMVRPSLLMSLARGDEYETQGLLDQVPAPVLLIQGGADTALHGPSQGRAMAAALGPKATYRELAGVGHEELLEQEATLAMVRDFIATAGSKLAG